VNDQSILSVDRTARSSGLQGRADTIAAVQRFRLPPFPSWGTEPTPDRARALSVQDFTVLWASFLIGVPALMAGVQLAAPRQSGGLGFSFGQLILAVLLGALLGSALLAGAAWVAGYNGVTTVLLLRPTLGITGSHFLAALNLIFLLGWAAFELGVAADGLNRALLELSGLTLGPGAVVLLALVAGVMLWAGPKAVAVVWVRRFAIWAALLLFLYLLWVLVSRLDLPALVAEPRAPGFWGGVDVMMLLAVLWFPVVADYARLASDQEAAASSAGVGFGVGAIVSVMVGALLAFGGGAVGATGSEVVEALGVAGAGLAGVILLAWVALAEADQPFAFLWSATGSAQVLAPRVEGMFLSAAALVVVGVAAAGLDPNLLLDYLRFFLSIYAPIFAVFAADFFVVRRRRYNVDDLYRREGEYRGFNWMALLPVLLGFIVYQWIDPVGPPGFAELVSITTPGRMPLAERFIGVPPALVSMLLSFAIYALVGRWRVKEEVHISAIRGRL
jgi:nucleobase:cation symporter-1, NCS1 family